MNPVFGLPRAGMMASDDGFSLEATTIKAAIADSRSPINVDALLVRCFPDGAVVVQLFSIL